LFASTAATAVGGAGKLPFRVASAGGLLAFLHRVYKQQTIIPITKDSVIPKGFAILFQEVSPLAPLYPGLYTHSPSSQVLSSRQPLLETQNLGILNVGTS